MPEFSNKKLLEVLNTACITLDADGIVIETNTVFQSRNIIDDSEIIGKPIADFIPEKDPKSLSSLLQSEIGEITLCFTDSQKVSKPISAKTVKTQNEDGTPVILVLLSTGTDQNSLIDKIASLEEQLRTERQLSVFGHIFPGIAHNINNPLAVIIGRIQLLQIQSPMHPEIGAVQNQAKAIKKIIDTISFKFNHETEKNATPIVIRDLLQNELDFLIADPFFKHKIQKQINLDINTPPVLGIYSDFSTAIMSIVNFSVDSMLGTDPKNFSLRLSTDSAFILIDIADTGLPIAATEIADFFLKFIPKQTERIGKQIIDLRLAYQLLEKYKSSVSIVKNDQNGKQFQIKIPCYAT